MDTAASAAPGTGTTATSAGATLLLFPNTLYHTDHGHSNQQQNNCVCKHLYHLSPNHFWNSRIDNEYQFQVNYMTSNLTCQLVFYNFFRFSIGVLLAFHWLSI